LKALKEGLKNGGVQLIANEKISIFEERSLA